MADLKYPAWPGFLAIPAFMAGGFGIMGLSILLDPKLVLVAGAVFAAVAVLAWLMGGRVTSLTIGALAVYAVGVFGVMLAAYYRIRLADFFQNQSDPYGFYLRTLEADQPMVLDSWLENRYEMRAATGVWLLANRFAALVGVSYTPEVATLFSVGVAAVTSVVVARIAGIWTMVRGRDYAMHAQHKAIAWFGTCGLLWSVTCVQLRDVFGCFYMSLCAWFVLRWLVAPAGLSRAFSLFSALTVVALASAAFALLRPDMMLLPVVFLMLTLVGEWSMKAILAVLVVVAVAVFSLGYLVFDCSTADLLGKHAEAYDDLAANSSSGYSRMVFGAPMYIKAFLGPWYLTMYPIPAFAPLKEDDCYGLFRCASVFWMMLAMPILIGGFIRSITAGGKVLYATMLSARAAVMLVMALLLLLGITSVEGRHLAPVLGLWAAFMAASEWYEDRLIMAFVKGWVTMVVAVNFVWLLLRV